MSVDLSQHGGSGSVGALTFDDEDSIGPRPSQLTEEEARLARTYHDADDIDADVNALQANINALIENMGDSTAHPHSHPSPLSSAAAGGEESPSALPASADFDFDAFFTAFASEQDGVTVPLPLPALGPDKGADTVGIAKVPVEDQPVAAVAGRKRTSDVAGLALHLPTPTPSPSRVGAVKVDVTPCDPPRVKRNKK
jgi:hypothetical protein